MCFIYYFFHQRANIFKCFQFVHPKRVPQNFSIKTCLVLYFWKQKNSWFYLYNLFNGNQWIFVNPFWHHFTVLSVSNESFTQTVYAKVIIKLIKELTGLSPSTCNLYVLFYAIVIKGCLLSSKNAFVSSVSLCRSNWKSSRHCKAPYSKKNVIIWHFLCAGTLKL